MEMVLIRLVAMGFSGVFSDPHYVYTGPTCGNGFNQTCGHGFQGMFSDPHCIYMYI